VLKSEFKIKTIMKKINIILLLFVVTFTSCEDAIDIEQVGRLTPDVAFETPEDLLKGLMGVYARYDITSEIALAAEYTDEVARGFATGGQGYNTGLVYNLTPASAAASTFWARGYSQLSAVNRLIEAAQFVEDTEDPLYDDVLGQAYALRAFSHFTLLSYYTTDYTDDNALGIIVVTDVPEIDEQRLRNTNGEVYAAINADLDRAEGLIDDQRNPIYVSRDFVKALRARMAAYRQNYTQAEQLALELVEDYPLANRQQYVAMFDDQDNTEIIFKLLRIDNDNWDGQGSQGSVSAGGWAGNVFAFTNGTLGGGVFYEIDRGLFNLWDREDIRFDVNVHPTSIIAADYQNTANYVMDDRLVVGKYTGKAGLPLMNDLKVFRSSEMQLIVAEARVALGRINGETNSAASALKELRDARFGEDTPLPVFADATEAYAYILNERRRELAFEGHRWKDLKRLGQRANQDAVRDPMDCAFFRFADACRLASDDYRFTLPLPLIEFNGNPGLREQQNPGY
jgi:starch-binding outer membrane protein, SusD/RagB family